MMRYLELFHRLMMRNKLFRLIIRFMNNGYIFISNDFLFFTKLIVRFYLLLEKRFEIYKNIILC